MMRFIPTSLRDKILLRRNGKGGENVERGLESIILNVFNESDQALHVVLLIIVHVHVTTILTDPNPGVRNQ